MAEPYKILIAPDVMNFEAAQEYCSLRGGRIFEPRSGMMPEFLVEGLRDEFGFATIWLGITDMETEAT